MTHSPAQVLRKLLLDWSGTRFTDPADGDAWPLYVSVLPDGEQIADEVVALYDTAGTNRWRLLTSGRNLPSYGVQLKSQARDYQDGYSSLDEVAAFLQSISNQTVTMPEADTPETEYTIDTVRQTSPVMYLGQDDKRRSLFTLNVLVDFIR